MKKKKDIYELTLEILDKNNVKIEQEGDTRLSFTDTEKTENWPALTALAMAVQQSQGIDNGLEKAIRGKNKKVINDILNGNITLAI